MDLSFVFNSDSVISLAKKSEILTNHWETVFKNLAISPDQNKILNYTNREYLVNSQMMALKACEESKRLEKEGKYFRVSNSVTQEEVHHATNSQTVLVDLNRIAVKDLILSINCQVDGKYFLCRNITIPLKMTALTTIVDDPSGKAVRLSLYNFISATENLQEIMPIGTILAIKNPFLKTSADGGLILRCDNPESVIYIDKKLYSRLFPCVTWIKDIHGSFNDIQPINSIGTLENPDVNVECEAVYWKNLGNGHFHRKDYFSAVNAYSTGLKAMPLNIELLSNRCAAFLSLRWYSSAISDADFILLQNPYHLKAICRKSKALCGINKCAEAANFLRATISEVPKESVDKQTLSTILDTTIMMKEQQEGGIYSIGKLQESKCVRLDNCAEYVGPVKIVEVKGKGRGLVATKNIAAGCLITASRAFEIDFNENANTAFHFSLSQETKKVCVTSNSNLIRQIALRLTAEPQCRNQFYSLYGGPNLDNDGVDNESLDLGRIKSICKYNSFQLDKPEQAISIEGTLSAGIWLLPSYINNSCSDANCNYDIYGDFMFVRACKDINEGEEILISYMHPTNSFDLREKRFTELYGFTCTCRLCENDRNDPLNAVTRNSTLKKFYDDRQNKNLNIEQLNHYLTTLRTCPRDVHTLNTELLVILVEISMQYMHNNTKNPEKAVTALEEAYNLLWASSLVHYKVNICKYLVAANLKLNSQINTKRAHSSPYLKNAKEWATKLKSDLQVAYGQDVEIEKVVTKKFINFVKSEGVNI